MLPRLTDQFCDRLRDTLRTSGFDADGVVAVLGDEAHAALGRFEPEPARRATRGGSPLDTLIRLFLVGDPAPRAKAEQALGDVDEAAAAGLVRVDGDDVRAALDLRPYGDEQGSW